MGIYRVADGGNRDIYLSATGTGGTADPFVPAVNTTHAIPPAVYYGGTTVAGAGTAVALAGSMTLTEGVRIKALKANAGTIYVGTAAVGSANGFELLASEEVYVYTANPALIFVNANSAGDGVRWIGQ